MRWNRAAVACWSVLLARISTVSLDMNLFRMVQMICLSDGATTFGMRNSNWLIV